LPRADFAMQPQVIGSRPHTQTATECGRGRCAPIFGYFLESGH
jgi:hypothetical protein